MPKVGASEKGKINIFRSFFFSLLELMMGCTGVGRMYLHFQSCVSRSFFPYFFRCIESDFAVGSSFPCCDF